MDKLIKIISRYNKNIINHIKTLVELLQATEINIKVYKDKTITIIKRTSITITTNVKKFLQLYRVVTILIVLFIVLILNILTTTEQKLVEVYINNELIAVTEIKNIGSKEKLEEDIIVEINTNIVKNNKNEVIIKNPKIDFKEIVGRKSSAVQYKKLVTLGSNVIDYEFIYYTLYVEGQPIFKSRKKEPIENVLDLIKMKYVTENTNKVEFLEKVELIETKYEANQNDLEEYTEEAMYEFLTREIVKERIHTVTLGDSLWDIGWANNLTVEQIIGMNPGLLENKILSIGDEIRLVLPKPFLSVKSIETKTYDDKAYREIEFIDNDKEYKTFRKTIIEGEDGKRTVTADIIFVNGIEIDRNIIKEIIHIKPIKKVVERGTLKAPPKRAIGSFINPAIGKISSRFGSRWGRLHGGIDIAGPIGTAIYASDGGKVVYSGWNGSFGYLVKIDHQNGFVTYYAHNSKNYVKTGEMVFQGQLIASIGSTGNSTGPHVHFEIRLNGIPKNPLNYLK